MVWSEPLTDYSKINKTNNLFLGDFTMSKSTQTIKESIDTIREIILSDWNEDPNQTMKSVF